MTESTEQSASSVPAKIGNPGKVSYMMIPALDARASGAFYEKVFGWRITGGGDAHLSFEDASGELIGAFEPGHTIPEEPGLIPYIYVTGIDTVVREIEASGGSIALPVYAEGQLWVAEFRDPAGNKLGIWQGGGPR
jgi:predicted enzyme related to lactoylglutathione lyase